MNRDEDRSFPPCDSNQAHLHGDRVEHFSHQWGHRQQQDHFVSCGAPRNKPHSYSAFVADTTRTTDITTSEASWYTDDTETSTNSPHLGHHKGT